MAKKAPTRKLLGDVAGQHLALSVAAHLARTQLVPKPAQVYDAQHVGDMLNVVAGALARVAPMYAADLGSGTPRQLQPMELEGAQGKRSATLLALKDGRVLSGVSIRRADLRHAIAVLKATGLKELAPPPSAPPPQPAPPAGAALLVRYREIERLLQSPHLPEQVERAKSIAIGIARNAPQGRIANFAMQLMNALQDRNAAEEVPGGYRLALARLRAALEEVETR